MYILRSSAKLLTAFLKYLKGRLKLNISALSSYPGDVYSNVIAYL